MLCRGDSSKWNVIYFPIHEGLNSDKRRSPSIKTYTNIDLALRTVEIFDYSKNYTFLGAAYVPWQEVRILIVDNKPNSVFDLLKESMVYWEISISSAENFEWKGLFMLKLAEMHLIFKNNFHIKSRSLHDFAYQRKIALLNSF